MKDGAIVIWYMGNGLYRVGYVPSEGIVEGDKEDIIDTYMYDHELLVTENEALQKAGRMEVDIGGTTQGILMIDNGRSYMGASDVDISEKFFYSPPPQEIYDEVKEKAIEIRGQYDDTYQYASNKINWVKGMSNESSSFMCIVQMFDNINKMKLLNSISDEARRHILIRSVGIFG